MMCCFPTPDFDLLESALTPISCPICFTTLSQVPPLFADFCQSKGFEIDTKRPLRSTQNSTVFKAIVNGQNCAFKVSRYTTRLLQEYIKRLYLPGCDYLVRTIYIFEEPTFSILQMELCCGDLNVWLNGRLKETPIQEGEVWKLIQDVSEGLKVIHKTGYIHLDISPSNILYNGDKFKISDFGTLCKIEQFKPGLEGAGPYVSPEILSLNYATFKSDIFSFGVVLLEVCSGFFAPRGGDQRYEQLRNGKIKLGEQPYVCSFGRELLDLVNSMLCQDFDARPSAEEVYQYVMKL